MRALFQPLLRGHLRRVSPSRADHFFPRTEIENEGGRWGAWKDVRGGRSNTPTWGARKRLTKRIECQFNLGHVYVSRGIDTLASVDLLSCGTWFFITTDLFYFLLFLFSIFFFCTNIEAADILITN